MQNDFITFISRGIEAVIAELQQYKTDTDVWLVAGEIKNSAGTLALHLNGSLNHFIGAVMANNGYVRNREAEFADRNIPREKIIASLNNTKTICAEFISKQHPAFFEATFPFTTFGDNRSNHYVLLQMVAHLQYHLGQINYHRRLVKQ